MKHYTTMKKQEKELLQITTKLTRKNHNRLANLKQWFNNKGVDVNQQEILNDLLEHSFTSTNVSIKIDNESFNYAEIIKGIDESYEKGIGLENALIEELTRFGYRWLNENIDPDIKSNFIDENGNINYTKALIAYENEIFESLHKEYLRIIRNLTDSKTELEIQENGGKKLINRVIEEMKSK